LIENLRATARPTFSENKPLARSFFAIEKDLNNFFVKIENARTELLTLRNALEGVYHGDLGALPPDFSAENLKATILGIVIANAKLINQLYQFEDEYTEQFADKSMEADAVRKLYVFHMQTEDYLYDKAIRNTAYIQLSNILKGYEPLIAMTAELEKGIEDLKYHGEVDQKLVRRIALAEEQLRKLTKLYQETGLAFKGMPEIEGANQDVLTVNAKEQEGLIKPYTYRYQPTDDPEDIIDAAIKMSFENISDKKVVEIRKKILRELED
jgi:hypothetical protein